MKLIATAILSLGLLASVAAPQASAQSYSAPGNDYVRQHPHGDRALWQYCQSHYNTDPRCFAITRPGRGVRR